MSPDRPTNGRAGEGGRNGLHKNRIGALVEEGVSCNVTAMISSSVLMWTARCMKW